MGVCLFVMNDNKIYVKIDGKFLVFHKKNGIEIYDVPIEKWDEIGPTIHQSKQWFTMGLLIECEKLING